MEGSASVGFLAHRAPDRPVSDFLENNMKKPFSPFRIVGTFWLVMGCIVLATSIFLPTKVGRIADAVAGGMLVLMGGIFLLFQKKFKG